MKPMKVTDREIVDVLLGHAEAAQEQRVRRAVQTDLKAAATYAAWSGTAEALRRGVSAEPAACQRIHDGVMARLRTPQPGDEALDLALVESWKRPPPPRRSVLLDLKADMTSRGLQRLTRDTPPRPAEIPWAAESTATLSPGTPFLFIRSRRLSAISSSPRFPKP